MIHGGIVTKHLEIDITGSHIDVCKVAFCKDGVLRTVKTHEFQLRIATVFLVIDVAVSNVEAVCAVVGQYFYFIAGQRVTAESVILCHIHVLNIVAVQNGIPEISSPELGGDIIGGI